MHYKLVPSGMRHTSLVEKGIQTFKVKFKSVLCGVDVLFLLKLWGRIIPQTDIQVNLPRKTNATPKLSAYAYLNRPHDFKRMPMAPLSCAVRIHKTPNCRASWVIHTISGWYLKIST